MRGEHDTPPLPNDRFDDRFAGRSVCSTDIIFSGQRKRERERGRGNFETSPNINGIPGKGNAGERVCEKLSTVSHGNIYPRSLNFIAGVSKYGEVRMAWRNRK